jgi:RNA polymerase II subunit A C-terminal domain phosphatase SSU72
MRVRGGNSFRPLLVLNLDVRDNATEAGVAAPLALGLCKDLQAAGDAWEAALEGILSAFETKYNRRPLYAVCYY